MAALGAVELTETRCPPAIAKILVGLYVPLLEFNQDLIAVARPKDIDRFLNKPPPHQCGGG